MMSKSDSRSEQHLVESLSAREREILSHMSENRSSRQIADLLMLSLSGVRWYARQIYGKLDVNSPRQAVTRARELGLLEGSDPAQSPRHNFPAELTPFVGRPEELAQICELLSEPTHRLLTLVGPGGIGKTRLAVRLATELLPMHADGAWLVKLANLSDPALVPQAVASVLDVREQPDRSLPQSLAVRLRSRHLLLVLDNCEHLLDACAQLANLLLVACPTLRIIATSREPLHITGELRWPVPPLSVPDSAHLSSVEDLIDYEAVQLFVQRAKVVFPSFSLALEDAPTIAQICCRLDGLPLAIELAAARVKVLSPSQIAARLDDRFGLLVDGGRTDPARQQTLRATLDWSHDLLSEQEQVLFRRLAVFAADFRLEAVEAICPGSGLDKVEILGLLTGLVDKSLVMVESTHSKERRYRMLETVRQYGLEQLGASGDAPHVGEGHLRWYLTLAKESKPYPWGAAETASLEQLMVERHNLRAALRWTLDNGKAEESLRLAAAMAWYWYVRAHLREGRDWLEQALAVGRDASKSARASALNAAGALAVLQGDHRWATELLEEVLPLEREPGCLIFVAWSKLELGFLALLGGHYRRAQRFFWECTSLFRELDDRAGIATVLLYQGIAAGYQGNHGESAALLQECLPTLRELGDGVGVARALHGLGMVARHQQDWVWAKASLGEAVRVAGEKGARLEIAQCLEGLAGMATGQRQPRRAARLFGAAEALRETIGAQQPAGAREEYVRDVEATRAQLDDRAFSAAWATGRSLRLEQAMAYALAETESAELTTGTEIPPGTRPLTPLQAAKRRYGGLTARQREVAMLVGQGKSNSAIAAELVVTVRTVEAHITHILRKLGFSSRTQIAAWAVDKKLAPPPKTLEERMAGAEHANNE
jgi:non-specific serine/threonine protein kinase